MALIEKLLGKLVKQGQLTLIMPTGEGRSFGPAAARR